MPDLASTAITEATSVFLNDPSKTRFTDAIMLPYIARAHREIQLRFHNVGIAALDEISANISLSSGDVTLGVNLPSDMIEPKFMEEKAPSETDYIPMEQTAWEPSTPQTDHLRYWTWREELIQLLGATAARDVRLRYLKSLTPIVAVSTPLGISNGLGFISARAAALAAKFNGNNPALGDSINQEAGVFLSELVRRGIKTSQGYGTRRKSFRKLLRG